MSEPEHTPEAHDVIACELAACILGQRRHADRVELRVDVAGRIMAMSRHLAAVQAHIGEALVEAMAPIAAQLAALAGPAPRKRWWQR